MNNTRMYNRRVAAGFGRHGKSPQASNDTYSIGPRRLMLITWPCDLDLWPWRSWRLWLIRVVVLHPCTKFEVRRPWRSEERVSALMSMVTLTLKLVSASKVGNLPSKFGHLVLELFAMYATDRRTHKSNAYCPLPYKRKHNNVLCVFTTKWAIYTIEATFTRNLNSLSLSVLEIQAQLGIAVEQWGVQYVMRSAMHGGSHNEPDSTILSDPHIAWLGLVNFARLSVFVIGCDCPAGVIYMNKGRLHASESRLWTPL